MIVTWGDLGTNDLIGCTVSCYQIMTIGIPVNICCSPFFSPVLCQILSCLGLQMSVVNSYNDIYVFWDAVASCLATEMQDKGW